MNKLFERVAKLESNFGGTEPVHLIKVRFIDPDTGSGDDAEITRIGCGDKTWHKQPNESQIEFETRALSEARGPNLAVGYAE